MNNTVKVLDRVKARLGGVSDYRAAHELGVTTQAVSKWRVKRNLMDDDAAIRAAEILGEPPGAILAMVQADKAKSARAKALWLAASRHLHRAGALASALVCILCKRARGSVQNAIA